MSGLYKSKKIGIFRKVSGEKSPYDAERWITVAVIEKSAIKNPESLAFPTQQRGPWCRLDLRGGDELKF